MGIEKKIIKPEPPSKPKKTVGGHEHDEKGHSDN